MKKIFRSIIDIRKNDKSTIEQSDLKANYRSFLASRVEPEDPSYIKLYHWIESHFREYEQIPSLELLYDKGTKEGDTTVLSSLKDIVAEQPYIGSNFKAILKDKFEEQSKGKLQSILTKTWQVANAGLKVGKKTLKGIGEASDYFMGEVRTLKYHETYVKTESSIRSEEDAQEVLKDYLAKKKDPLAAIGMYTFLERIDDVQRGTKPGQLMIVAGYVGQSKTTVVANLAYNGIMQGLNGLYVTLEMPFEDMRRMLYLLHSSNPEWYDHPKYKNLAGKLSFDKLRYGEFTDTEEEFFQVALKDFVAQESFGNLTIHQPTEMLTPAKLEYKMYDVNAALVEEGKKLDFVIVDYVGLMYPDKAERQGDRKADLNSMIQRFKNLSITFDNGRGVRFITPWQMNRQGWKEAEKNEGIYKLSALSDSNETERSADMVVSVFMTEEMQRNSLVKIGCMKHRWGAPFPAFEAHLDFSSRTLRDLMPKKTAMPDDELLKEIPVNV